MASSRLALCRRRARECRFLRRPNVPFAELVRLSRTSIADEMQEEHRRRVLGEPRPPGRCAYDSDSCLMKKSTTEPLRTLVPVHGTHGCVGFLLRTARGFRAFDIGD